MINGIDNEKILMMFKKRNGVLNTIFGKYNEFMYGADNYEDIYIALQNIYNDEIKGIIKTKIK